MTRRVRDTEGAATEALRRLRAEDSTVRPGDPPPPLDTFMKAWLADTKARVRPATYKQYESVTNGHVIPAFGPIAIDRIRPPQIAQALRALESADVGARTREMFVIILRAALNTAVGHAIDSNPVQKGHRPRVPRRTMSVWNQEQARAFLAHTASYDLGPLYRLALSVGLRRGELVALRWVDVDLKKGRLHVQHTIDVEGTLAEPKTAGSRRAIELPSRVTEALKGHRKTHTGEYLFEIAPRHLNTMFDRAIESANVDRPAEERIPRIRFHDLRHTCATLRLQAGDHPKVVQEMLGHASITITLQTYSHVLPSQQREAADRFNDVL